MFRRRSDHNRVEGLLSAYVDGEVSIEEATLVERHLRECAACVANLATIRQTVGLVRQLPQVKVPRSFTLGSLPAEAPPRRAWGYVYLRGATALAAMLVLALLATDLGLSYFYGSVVPAAAPRESQMAVVSPTSQPLAAIGLAQASPSAEGVTEEALRAAPEGGMDVEAGKGANVPTAEATPTSVPTPAGVAQRSPMPSASPTITPTVELTPSPEATSTPTLEPTPTSPVPGGVAQGPSTPSSPPPLTWLRALEAGAFLLFVVLAGVTASVAWRRRA